MRAFRTRATRLLSAILGLLALAALPAAAAEKKGRKLDVIWVHPRIDSFAIRGIAMLQPASFDRSLEAEKLADQRWGAALRPTGYRWIGAQASRALLARTPEGDSLLALARARLLEQPRLDSLLAPELARRLRADAVLTLRIDRWEKLEMEFNQAGKPSTSIQLKAALVDSSGTLLWSAAGSETAEGPYHDPSSAVVGIKSSGLGTTPVTGQGGAPSFLEVLNTLFARWVERFPRPGAAPAAP